MCILCHILCKRRGFKYIALFVNAERNYGKIHRKLIITCDGVGGCEPIGDTDEREIFYYVLFCILNFELCKGIVYSFKNEGLLL